MRRPGGPRVRRSARVHERGASAVEYALLVVLVAAVIAGAVLLLGLHLPALYRVTF